MITLFSFRALAIKTALTTRNMATVCPPKPRKNPTSVSRTPIENDGVVLRLFQEPVCPGAPVKAPAPVYRCYQRNPDVARELFPETVREWMPAIPEQPDFSGC